jgi:anti-sigma regulatory factor (Ser/Thr protein kinase)
MSVRLVPTAQPPPGRTVGEWPLSPDPASARQARRLVTQAMQGAREHVLRCATLVTSELVANSVRHAKGGIGLALQRIQGGWVVSVSDNSRTPPQLPEPRPHAESGRGLLIVERVSQSVGWARTRTGKVVWAYVRDSTD